MKHHVRMGGFFLSAALLVAYALNATAATAGQFIRGYGVEDNNLDIYCSSISEGGNLTLSLNKEPIEADVLTTEEANCPVTICCLVDVSGSMKESQIEQVKTALLEINAHMGEKDLMVLNLLGNQVTSSEILKSSTEREQAINALEAGHEDTNLYAGIIESLNDLQTSSNYTKRRYLIVFSDGADMQDMGSTETAVYSAISQTTLPVYAVATLRDNPTQEQRDNADALCSLAKSSLGGIGLAPILSEQTGTAAGAELWDAIQSEIILQIDVSALEVNESKDTLILRAEYTNGTTKYEDTIQIYTEDLPKSTPQPEPEPVPAPEPDSGIDYLLIVGIIVAALIIIIIVVIVVKKKQKVSQQREETSEIEKKSENIANSELDVRPISEPEQESAPEIEPKQVLKKPASTKALSVTLTAIAHPDVVYKFAMPEHETITLGRRGKVQFSATDTRVSGLHCEMHWVDGKLYLRDTDSKNGTFINGIQIKGRTWTPLEYGGIVRIGSYDYRVKYDT